MNATSPGGVGLVALSLFSGCNGTIGQCGNASIEQTVILADTNGSCVSDDGNTTFYAVKALNNSAHTYKIAALCAAGCTGCPVLLTNASLQTCYATTANMSVLLQRPDEMATCGTLPVTPNRHTSILAPALAGGLGAAALVCAVGVLVWWRQRRRRVAADFSVLSIQSDTPEPALSSWETFRLQVRAAATWFFGLWQPFDWAALTASDGMQMAGLLATATWSAAQAGMWLVKDPFEPFEGSLAVRLGLNQSYVDVHALQQHFVVWSSGAAGLSGASAGLMLIAVLLSCWMRDDAGYRLRVFSACLALVLNLGTILFPPFTFLLHKDIHLHNIDFLDRNPGLKADFQAAAGYALTGVTLSFLAAVFLYLVSAIAPGVFAASLAFIHLNLDAHVRQEEEDDDDDERD